MTQQSNPEIDFGFFAALPRIVRTGYKNLTAVHKWLYTCLKDLCGDHGTCYRTVRTLALETDLSIGTISESIPLLHKAGLIHAEKKKRSTGGKEVWHITIIDIWAANGKMHPTKKRSDNEQSSNVCSPDEQECSGSEQTNTNVQDVNENVHTVNDKGRDCSPDEQECSGSEPARSSESALQASSDTQKGGVRKNNRRKNNIEGRTGKEDSATVVVDQCLSIDSSIRSSAYINKNSSQEEEPATKPTPKWTPEESQLLDWVKECNVKKPRGDAAIREHLQALLPALQSQERLNELFTFTRNRILEDNRKRDKTVWLGNLVENRDSWLQSKMPTEPQGFTVAERDDLIRAIESFDRDLVINGKEEGGLWYMFIPYSDDFGIKIHCRGDWARASDELLAKAHDYGAAYWAALEANGQQ